jgi:hypothetical protein
MMRLLMDRDQRREMGRNARLDAEQYSIERTMQMMLERYQLVIDRAAGRRKPNHRKRLPA